VDEVGVEASSEFELKLVTAPAGWPLTESVTYPANPLLGAMKML